MKRMNEYKKIILLVIFFVQIVFEINARRFNIRDEKEPEEKVRYRPDKYIENGLVDIILGNQTLINVMFRDIPKLLKKVTGSKYITLFSSIEI